MLACKVWEVMAVWAMRGIFPATSFSKFLVSQNNSLKLVASFLLVWITIKYNYMEKETCFLALGDNSSAIRWFHKATVDETKTLSMHIAVCKYAEILLQADCCLYSWHLSGINNNVADALSCKVDLSDDDLT
jgi:hypothetical protein